VRETAKKLDARLSKPKIKKNRKRGMEKQLTSNFVGDQKKRTEQGVACPAPIKRGKGEKRGCYLSGRGRESAKDGLNWEGVSKKVFGRPEEGGNGNEKKRAVDKKKNTIRLGNEKGPEKGAKPG